MPDPGLVQALDYILNHSDESTIEVLAEAIVRRRRDMSVFNAVGSLPDPQKMAQEITARINEGLGSGIENMRQSIRQMIYRIIAEHAPELSENQIAMLCEPWLPEGTAAGAKNKVPKDMMLSMIEQFVSFSTGTMTQATDQNLRNEMGAWPKRYWDVFPPVIRQIITDYLKERISEKDFYTKIDITLR